MAMCVTYTTINGQIVKENRGGTESYYVPDTLGSTAALMSSTGTITDTYDYWPYGEILNHTGSSTTPFTYIGTFGYYLQIPGNFSYIRFRYLRQALANWQTKDPIWPLTAPYSYVDNSPTTNLDVFGLQKGVLGLQKPTPPPPVELPGQNPVRVCPIPVGTLSLCQGCILFAGVEACGEMCTYSPGHPTGPFTWCGEELASVLPFCQGPSELPAPAFPRRRRPPKTGNKATSCTCYINESGPPGKCRGDINTGVTVTIPPGEYQKGRDQCQYLRSQYPPQPGCTISHINCK